MNPLSFLASFSSRLFTFRSTKKTKNSFTEIFKFSLSLYDDCEQVSTAKKYKIYVNILFYSVSLSISSSSLKWNSFYSVKSWDWLVRWCRQNGKFLDNIFSRSIDALTVEAARHITDPQVEIQRKVEQWNKKQEGVVDHYE